MNAMAPDPIPYFLTGRIRRCINKGRYPPPGSLLREKQLEAESGASRGPLRDPAWLGHRELRFASGLLGAVRHHHGP